MAHVPAPNLSPLNLHLQVSVTVPVDTLAEVTRVVNGATNLQLCARADNKSKAQLVNLLRDAVDSLNGAGYAHDRRTQEFAARMARQTKDKIARTILHIVAADARTRAAAFEARMRAASPSDAADLGWRP